jgi:hypothetical protein
MISSFCPLYICRKATQGPQRGALSWKRPPLFIIGNWTDLAACGSARSSEKRLRAYCLQRGLTPVPDPNLQTMSFVMHVAG